MTQLFPFTAIVGQEELKLALILNIIDPSINGVLIMGDRGTGKSTTVRSLLDLLPEIRVVKNDPFNRDPLDPSFNELMFNNNENNDDSKAITTTSSDNNFNQSVSTHADTKDETRKIPLVDLPLGATEDRVVRVDK